MNEITFTKVNLPYGWLGNMAPYQVTHEGRIYRTTEALFQALRFNDPIIREQIRTARSPMTAMIAKSFAAEMVVVVRQGLADINNMRLVLGLKLEQHPDLRRQLRETGEAVIIEDCTARPHGSGLFWGAAREPGGGWRGDNWLGFLWMEFKSKEMP